MTKKVTTEREGKTDTKRGSFRKRATGILIACVLLQRERSLLDYFGECANDCREKKNEEGAKRYEEMRSRSKARLERATQGGFDVLDALEHLIAKEDAGKLAREEKREPGDEPPY
jgi:hypothetical protein